MIPLRDYQQRIDDEVHFHLGLGIRNPLVVSPTGSGKTRVMANLADTLPGNVWILAHRQELISQSSNTLQSFGIVHGIVKSGFEQNYRRRVQAASVQTVSRRLESLPPPAHIITDEAHHISPTYRRIYERFPEANLIGFTATPCLLNGKGLGEVYGAMILGPTVSWLQEKGFAPRLKYYAPPPKADTSGLPVRGGDYATKESEEVMNKEVITGDAIEHYRRVCEGAPMLVFCTSVKHAEDVAAEYRRAGYRAASVDGSLDDDERADRIGGLESGKYQIVTSCDLVGEGLDVPVCAAVQLLRPTASLALHRQMLGRLLRLDSLYEVKYVLDHVGNTGRMVRGKWEQKHGFAETEYEWSLEGVKKKKKEPGERPISVRTCSSCFSVHQLARSCPYCGFEYPVKVRGSLDVEDGDLMEIMPTKEQARELTAKAKTYAEFFAIAKAMKYERPHFWALKKCGRLNHMAAMPKLR